MPRILYVDDEEDVCEVAQMSLELDPDLEVKTCSNGAAALGFVADWQPDLVMLDVMMPGMDGPETLASLRANPANSRPPVIFITARTQERDVVWLKSLGAVGVIAKPFDPMTLAQQVRAYLP